MFCSKPARVEFMLWRTTLRAESTKIIQPKINGEIFNIENHKEFAQKIQQILHENHDSESIKNSIKSRFSKDIILGKYEDLFNEILSVNSH